jgi:hypothetical protein
MPHVLIDPEVARRHRLTGGLAAAAVAAIVAGAAILLGPDRTVTPSRPGFATNSPAAALLTVTGVLRAVGGPAIATPRGLPGIVAFTGRHGTSFTARTGTDGRFTVKVPPGYYDVTGTSPLYNDGRAACRAASPAVVEAAQMPTVDVDCVEK